MPIEGVRADGQRATPRPTIKVEPGMMDVLASAAEAALIRSGIPVYQRGRNLVQPATQEVAAAAGRRTTAACFAELTQAGMLDFLSRAAD